MKDVLLGFCIGFVGIVLTLAFEGEPLSKGPQDANTIVLTDDNTVVFNMPVMGDTVKQAQLALLERSQNMKKNETIYLVLNSPGGSVEDGFHLIEFAKGLPQKVKTISMFSASMSFLISQFLEERLVLKTSLLMSHRATVGDVGGQVPGSFMSRAQQLDDQMKEIDEAVAQRAGLSLEEYRKLNRDELWMSGAKAVEMHMADRIVSIRCDKSLSSYNPPQQMSVGPFTFAVSFHKCPLITEPIIAMGEGQDSAPVRRFISTGRFQ